MKTFSSAINIQQVAEVFYAHYANVSAGKRIPPLLARRLDTFETKLAEMLEDFATLACFGELRHAGDHIVTHTLDLFTTRGGVTDVYLATSGRDRICFICDYVYSLSKKSILMTAIDIFDNFEWENGYGGGSWQRVAETTLRYMEKEISAVGYVDRMFHIVHNGGRLFDKDIIFKEDSCFRDWLDCRQKGLWDEYFLESLQTIALQNREIIDEVINYEPVAWGEAELGYESYEKDYRREDYDEEWEEEESPSYEEESEEEKEEMEEGGQQDESS